MLNVVKHTDHGDLLSTVDYYEKCGVIARRVGCEEGGGVKIYFYFFYIKIVK